MEVSITKSSAKNKKLTAVFFKDGKKVKTINFGSSPNKDFTIYSKEDKKLAQQKKDAYIKRHSVRENFNDPMTAGALSRWILWNKPTISASISDFLKRFKLKKHKSKK
jgi:predicted HTH transcriptional regulator